MDKEKVYVSTIRFYMDRQLHNQAYEQLMQRDKQKFKKKDDFIAEVILYHARHLEQESEMQAFHVISDHFGNGSSYIYDIIRSVLTEVMEAQLQKLCEVPGDEGTSDAKPEEKEDCTDRDKRFAAFYDFEDD